MGSEYPMFLEKIVFIGLLIGSIFAGNMLSDHLSGVQLWLSWICGIPILLLIVTEFLEELFNQFMLNEYRIIRSFLVKSPRFYCKFDFQSALFSVRLD